jgi:aspartyl-tRNA(Asn)/glutamyl-tRNA(Gln) amidotransferase subunit A
MKSVSQIGESLARRETSAEAIVRDAFDRIDDPAGEGARTFIRVFRGAQAEARAYDAGHAGARRSPVDGLPISVKDLFDVADNVTTAGSTALRDHDDPAASRDATVVARLRAAGAIIIGSTNMTEFAFSGVGLNPHYGTPLNPSRRDERRIPGGSSSGAAVSVTDGMAAAALGTDTGGSVRIPAALCGLAGFKPTARRIPIQGVVPLAPSLDSVGPLAPTVECCAILDSIIAGGDGTAPTPRAPGGIRLGVVDNYVLDGLDKRVAEVFAGALTALSAAGVAIRDTTVPEFDELPSIKAHGGIVAAQAWTWHRNLIARRGDEYDPRVRNRIERGAAISDDDLAAMVTARAEWISRVAPRLSAFDALALPTIAVVAPRISELESTDEYFRWNARILRNTGIANFADCCAVTISCHRDDGMPVGFMLMAPAMADRDLLAIAMTVERILAAGHSQA